MRKITKSILLLTSAVCLSSSQLSAVTTDPVGYVTLNIPSGLSILSLPLQKSPVFVGEVSAVNGSVISCDVDALDSDFYYVQVVGSDQVLGKIANVSGSAAGSVTISPEISGLVPGDTIVVRPHFTLEDIYAEPEFSDGDTVTIYTADGTKDSFEYISSSTLGIPRGVWADENSEDASSVAVIPSEGFVFGNSSTPKSVVVAGAVPTSALAAELGSSFSILGSNTPADSATIGTVFAGLNIGSTITVYSSDGTLSVVSTYEVFDSADLDLGVGKTFVRDGEFLGDDDTVPVGAGIVVSPSSGNDLLIPASYSSVSID